MRFLTTALAFALLFITSFSGTSAAAIEAKDLSLVPRYAGGTCKAFLQNWRNSEETQGTITVWDASARVIGYASGLWTNSDGGSYGLESELPWVLIFTYQFYNGDNVHWDYADQHWDSNGSWNDGYREINVFFAC